MNRVIHVPLKPGRDAFNTKALISAITACQLQNLRPVLAPEVDGSGTTALIKQYQRVRTKTPHVLITCGSVDTSKCRYVAEGRKAIRFNDQDPTWMFEGPEVIADVVARTGCGLFEPTGFKYPVHFRSLRQASFDSGYGHHPKAINLEEDRAWGRKVASEVGMYSTPITQVVTRRTDLREVAKKFRALFIQHVAIKRATGQFIQKATTVDLERTLLELLPGGTLTVEEWITGKEFDVSFFVHGANVRPMLYVQETNKLLPNGSGGKLGTAWSKHVIVENNINPWLRYATEGMQRIAEYLVKQGTPLVGWVDASFIEPTVGNSKVPRHIEWMIRGGVSNFITIAHQLDLGYLELFPAVCRGADTLSVSKLWRAPVSYGVEVYTLPFNISHAQPTTVFNRFESGLPNLTFDPLDQAAVFYNYATSSVPIFGTDSPQRVGVFSMLEASSHLPSDATHQMIRRFVDAVPNGAYRYLTE